MREITQSGVTKIVPLSYFSFIPFNRHVAVPRSRERLFGAVKTSPRNPRKASHPFRPFLDPFLSCCREFSSCLYSLPRHRAAASLSATPCSGAGTSKGPIAITINKSRRFCKDRDFLQSQGRKEWKSCAHNYPRLDKSTQCSYDSKDRMLSDACFSHRSALHPHPATRAISNGVVHQIHIIKIEYMH
jgi:hypothetical protein